MRHIMWSGHDRSHPDQGWSLGHKLDFMALSSLGLWIVIGAALYLVLR